MDLVVVGSNPITHPDKLESVMLYRLSCLAPVAQLDRATDFESVGRTFEPCRAQNSNKVLR